MISFFVDGKEIEGVKEMLKVLDFPVRSNGFARPEEVAFFFNSEKKGFCFNAYKLEDCDIPDSVCASPFLVCVGKEWTIDGLFCVVKQYRDFFLKGIPVLNPEEKDEVIIEICRRCITLPWGGFPQTKEGEKKLANWLRKVSLALFPLSFQGTSKLTDLW
jgi:hypothetical protein